MKPVVDASGGLWLNRARQAVVAAVIEERPGLQVLAVLVDGVGGASVEEAPAGVAGKGLMERRAACFPLFTGPAAPGDRVILNTTAVDLGLGSGGYDFVMAVLGPGEPGMGVVGTPESPPARPGHIMKLRYTPVQLACLAVEEEDSPYHEAVDTVQSLDGLPVLIGGVHSLVAPLVVGAALAARDSPGAGGWRPRVAYVMSDGAALPLAWSKTARRLRETGFLVGTVTFGNAFGGDLEAVTCHSALAACVAVLRADVIVVAMGPGVVGTGTRLGNSALEVGEVVDAVNLLGGEAIAVPRISVADERARHRGISHHFLTALAHIANTPATIVLPETDYVNVRELRAQVDDAGLTKPGRWRPCSHRVVTRKPPPDIAGNLARLGLEARFMGRSPEEEPAFFAAAAVAGAYAAEKALSRRAGRGGPENGKQAGS